MDVTVLIGLGLAIAIVVFWYLSRNPEAAEENRMNEKYENDMNGPF